MLGSPPWPTSSERRASSRGRPASNAALQEDVAGFGEISFLFPVLFLGSAAMATFVLQGRLIRSQRAQIATLRANGLSTQTVVAHHLAEGASSPERRSRGCRRRSPTGAARHRCVHRCDLGAGHGHRFHWETVVIALVLAVATGLVATAAPTIAAARTSPR
jgi:putative ABC transport system permease protein